MNTSLLELAGREEAKSAHSRIRAVIGTRYHHLSIDDGPSGRFILIVAGQERQIRHRKESPEPVILRVRIPREADERSIVPATHPVGVL